MVYAPASTIVDAINTARQSKLAEQFEELNVDYMRGFIDYYYTQKVGKVKGFILKQELGLSPPIIIGAMHKSIKKLELLERKNYYEWIPYKDGYMDSFVFFNENIAKKININKEDRPTFNRLEQLINNFK